jgi:wyosine [tRNA(Phe)-imidazoG37] synthetase (radical SAM superfamily)
MPATKLEQTIDSLKSETKKASILTPVVVPKITQQTELLKIAQLINNFTPEPVTLDLLYRVKSAGISGNTQAIPKTSFDLHPLKKVASAVRHNAVMEHNKTVKKAALILDILKGLAALNKSSPS